MDGDAGLFRINLLDAHDLAHIFAIHGIVRRGIGKRDEDAHAGIVGLGTGDKVESVLRGVNADGHIFKMIVARLGGANTNGPGDLGSAATAFF